MTIFLDSSILCAYANLDDVHHKTSVSLVKDTLSGKYGKCVITDYIMDETLTVLQRKSNKKTAIELGKFILDSEFLIAEIDKQTFQKAWEIFQQDNNFSFTDCTILAFMWTFGINQIATFDKEFSKISNIEVVKNS